MGCTRFAPLVGILYFFKLKKQNYGAMHHSLNKSPQSPAFKYSLQLCGSPIRVIYKGHDVAMRWLFWVVFFFFSFVKI